ncbi:MAG TPA: hypothetical protein VLC10_00275 [Patescibacteria group bacterium]|nr:hypothetical protein [Patescibacteria group bacterium]
MEFFSDHWLLWTCFFAPAIALLGAAKLARKRLPLEDAVGVVAFISGFLLVMGLIHVVVGFAVDGLMH